MKRYKAYKDSGVEWIGEIPVGWEMCRVNACFAEERRVNSDLASFNALKFSSGSIVPKADVWDESEIAETYSRYHKVEPGTIVVNNLNLNFDLKSKRVGMVEEGGIITSAYLALVPGSNIDCRFANYTFKSWDYRKAFHGMGKGLRLTLDWNELGRKLIQLPPMWEQQAIADYLDAKTAEIDGLVADCEREVELLQEYRKAVISEAVTKGLDPNAPMKDSGVEWIGEIPDGWRVVKLGHIASSTLGKMLDSEKQTGNCPARYLSNRDVQWFKIDSAELKEMDFPPEARESYKILDGDLLVCEGGEVGRCAVWRGPSPDFFFQKAIHRVRFDCSVMDPDFAAYQMFQKAQVSMFREVRKGESTIGHLPGEQLSKLMMIVPPVSQQRTIVAYLDAKTAEIDSLIDAKREMAEKLREYRKSLISEAVTGKFKVPGV